MKKYAAEMRYIHAFCVIFKKKSGKDIVLARKLKKLALHICAIIATGVERIENKTDVFRIGEKISGTGHIRFVCV
ncbi:hypothetical protein B5F07_08780 [Lachnoclostridium sp. An169]|uniref:hypothetical protein n=1 Tax=Lachnoclostridium sp. An169 TaxID=1965569 RepID=UPI000B371834|nr:hypothetical protein [Lachnoclostridium sp. An169]OUP83940.1 hypothetical protein B5F07_08780 [Lachnoclostridium sp. An169]HJA66001.1 hypothetical protein [Candidatus Mediterraneibacter cottocaccae]